MVLLVKIRANWLRIAVHAGALLPLGWLLWAYSQDLFLVDPVREITTFTGQGAILLLLLSLACTPIVTLTGYKRVSRVRRALGLYAFVYAGLHFLTFIGLDYGFEANFIQQAIVDQRYVIAGTSAGLILLALALTSTQGWQVRLRKNWKRLHRLVYLAGILAVVHVIWLSKDPSEALHYVIILSLLLALRLPPLRRMASRARYWLTDQTRRLRQRSDALA
jgi:sulfoxide reductase heme-binding subunit YedZ